MKHEARLAAYARQNGQEHRWHMTMTPRQRKRYWKKWFQQDYIAPVLATPEGLELEGLIEESIQRAKKDREAPRGLWGPLMPIKPVPVSEEPRRWEYPVGGLGRAEQ